MTGTKGVWAGQGVERSGEIQGRPNRAASADLASRVFLSLDTMFTRTDLQGDAGDVELTPATSARLKT
jgi:hypothetical protein